MHANLATAVRTCLTTLLCATAINTGALAQQPESLTERLAAARGEDLFRAPIHTAVSDPAGGAYGIWASGNTYKVSFHDGMTFHPNRGPGAQPSPAHWRTSSITIGETSLLGSQPARPTTHSTDWRFEYRYGEVTEAYDVVAAGVEQTFVFRQPLRGGDLVIRGTLESALRADAATPRHGGLTFHDASGRAVLEYGAATVLDASGRSLPITTQCIGNEIELRVPADWLADAVAPITVDPLLQTVAVANSSGYPTGVAISRDDESNQLMIAYSRWMNLENDMFVIVTDDDLGNSTIVYSDVTNSWKSREPAVAFVGGANAWLITFTREFSSTSRAVRYHTHAKGQLAFSTGVKALPKPAGLSSFASDIGGAPGYSNGVHALVVFEADDLTSPFGTANTEVCGVLVDAANETAGPAFVLSPQGGAASGNLDRDRENPAVIPERDSESASWIVVWQEYNNAIANDDWDIYVARIDASGTPVGQRAIGNGGASRHGIRPHVGGRGGRYLVAFGDEPNNGKTGQHHTDNVYVQRVDWQDNANLPTLQGPRLIRDNPQINYFVGDVAFDQKTRSHWVVVSQGMSPHQVIFADMIGYRGGVVESVTVSPNPGNSDFSPTVTFNDDSNDFVIVHGGTAKKIFGRKFQRLAANTANYGTGCGPAQIAGIGVPYSGAEFFSARLSGAQPNTNAILYLSLSPTTIALDFIGMPGCFMNVSPNSLFATLPLVTGVNYGDLKLSLPAPLHGDVYAQYLYLAPGANALGAYSTEGMKIEIR